MEFRAYLTTILLIAAIAVALLGLGGEGGNGAGLLFWSLLAVIAIFGGLTLRRGGDEKVTNASRRTTNHERW